MARLLIHVEGQTEETFVNELIAGHLANFGISPVGARLLGNARQRNHRGGICGWPQARKDIIRHLSEDTGCTATLLVDYYGLPSNGPRAWPGRQLAALHAFPQQATIVQDALMDDVCAAMGPNFDLRRFIPFVVMHEFE